MTNKEKKLIIEAKNVNDKDILNYYFCAIYMINSGRLYNGFWGKNGFNNIILLGETLDGELINITGNQEVDIFNLDCNDMPYINFEIIKKSNCFHLYVNPSDDYCFKITNISSMFRLKIIETPEEARIKIN